MKSVPVPTADKNQLLVDVSGVLFVWCERQTVITPVLGPLSRLKEQLCSVPAKVPQAPIQSRV